MRMKRLRGGGALAVLVVAVVAVLGHVCTLPAHAHAVPVDGHDSHGEHPAGHSMHSASCDAIKTTPTASVLPPAVAAESPIAATAQSYARHITPHPVLQAKSPPLFLRHAALLI
jgi:hypothetical protein